MGMTKYKHRWQYNGVVPFNQVLNWCDQHNIVIWNEWETLYFTNEQDYLLFLLRWT